MSSADVNEYYKFYSGNNNNSKYTKISGFVTINSTWKRWKCQKFSKQIEASPSWEANSGSASQGISHL
jgi:hypothetical protein